jgi:arylsulfatase A-like enzyme
MTTHTTSRRLLCAVIAALGPITAAAPARAATRPNIVLILMDNLGYGDLGANGGGALRGAETPRIDRLASEGVRLTNFNVEAQCTPSRSAFMTGRFAIRSGTHSVPIGVPYYGLVPWEITIAEALSNAGYATGIFGKWHLGKTPARFPTDQGFDEWYGIPNSSDEALWPAVSDPAAAALHLSTHIMEGRKGEGARPLEVYDLEARRRMDSELTLRSIDFMRRSTNHGKPFFAYVPLTQPHFPTLPDPSFAGRTGAGDYADVIAETDHHVGEIVDAVTELGIEKDTIVIFTSDNGPEDPNNGGGRWSGSPGPWAGTYFTAMEGGIRVPFVMRWPGKVPAGRVSNEIVHCVDLFPTLARMAGAAVPSDRPIDGVDQSDFLFGTRSTSNRPGFVIFVGDQLYAVKWHNWKIHFIWQETKYDAPVRFSTVPKVVNLITDARERRQVAEPDNTWIQYPTTQLVGAFTESVKKFPSVPTGAPDDYQPPK